MDDKYVILRPDGTIVIHHPAGGNEITHDFTEVEDFFRAVARAAGHRSGPDAVAACKDYRVGVLTNTSVITTIEPTGFGMRLESVIRREEEIRAEAEAYRVRSKAESMNPHP